MSLSYHIAHFLSLSYSLSLPLSLSHSLSLSLFLYLFLFHSLYTFSGVFSFYFCAISTSIVYFSCFCPLSLSCRILSSCSLFPFCSLFEWISTVNFTRNLFYATLSHFTNVFLVSCILSSTIYSFDNSFASTLECYSSSPHR